MKKVIALILSICLHSNAFALEFIFEKDDSLPLVYVTAAFRGGSTQDPDSKNGLTALMGQMMLRGTKNKTKQQIDLALDSMGAMLEFEPRAEFIAFRGAVLSSHLDAFLSLLGEIITTPSFRTIELERLKKEHISNLLGDLSSDRNLAKLRFEQTFFKGHPYSKVNTGKIKDVTSVVVTDLESQYQKLISAKNMVLLASGDRSKSDFEPFIQKIERDRSVDLPLTTIQDFSNTPKKLRVVIFDKPDRTQTQILIGQKGVSILDQDVDALNLANHVFGAGGFQSRLLQELRVKRGWTYGAGSNFKFGSAAHTWKIGFFPKNADTPPAIKEALKMISDLGTAGITEEEFQASKKSLINSDGFTYNTPQKRMEARLTEVLFKLPDGYLKKGAERIKKLTRDQVNVALRKFIKPNELMIGLVATASVTRPALAKTLGIKESEIEVISYQAE